MFEGIEFHPVAGRLHQSHIQLLALSTCGFCRRGQEFLEGHGLAYEYIHLDLLDPEVKVKMKQEFKERFDATLSYPALVVDNDKHTVGYVKHQWEELLGLGHESEVGGAKALE